MGVRWGYNVYSLHLQSLLVPVVLGDILLRSFESHPSVLVFGCLFPQENGYGEPTRAIVLRYSSNPIKYLLHTVLYTAIPLVDLWGGFPTLRSWKMVESAESCKRIIPMARSSY